MQAWGVAIQSDGKIVAAGDSNFDFAVVRYNTDGSLDTSFGAGGKVTTALGSSFDYGYSLALQPDGKIVVCGQIGGDFGLVRYNTDGSLDTSFDGDGKVITALGPAEDSGQSVAIQPDGKIVAAGRSSNGINFDFAVVRYNPDGSLDTSFNGDGKVTTAVGPSDDHAWGVALQSDGKIVVCGETRGNFALVRYNADGSLDTSFGEDGKTTTDIGSTNDLGLAVAIQSDGKIVVAGKGGGGFAVARYIGDVPAPEVTVQGNGVTIADGDTTPSTADYTDFGSVAQGEAAISHTFTVRNDGGSALTLATVSVPTGYTLTKAPASSLAPGASDTFTVELETATAGTKTGEISFANNDGDGGDGVENPFHFTITGTVVAPATVGDRVWLDEDGDGIQGTGEPGVANVTVQLLDGSGNPTGLSTTTDSSGHYSFMVAAGTYRLAFAAPSGMAWTRADAGSDETLDSDVDPATGRTGALTVTAGQTDTSWDGGLVATIAQWASSVLGYSSQYAASPAPWSSSRALGAADVTVYRDDPNAWAPSVANGTTEWIALGYTTPVYATGVRVRESFGNGAVTKIELREQATGTWHQVWSGADPTAAGGPADFDVTFGPTSYLADGVRITLDMNHSPAWEEIDAVQLRGVQPATVGDRVWLDEDGDGIQDTGEPGVTGVTVRLLDGYGNPTGLSTTTDGNGYYGFTVAPGTYRLAFAAPSGMAWTRADAGSDETLDSDVDPATGRTGAFTVVAGQTDTSWDGGLVRGRSRSGPAVCWGTAPSTRPAPRRGRRRGPWGRRM